MDKVEKRKKILNFIKQVESLRETVKVSVLFREEWVEINSRDSFAFLNKVESTPIRLAHKTDNTTYVYEIDSYVVSGYTRLSVENTFHFVRGWDEVSTAKHMIDELMRKVWGA